MSNNSCVEVIAEAGSNHNGDPGRAIELINIAKEAGASSVKFQFIFADGLYVPKFYIGKATDVNKVFAVRKAEELTRAEWQTIWDYAGDAGIGVSASVFCKKGLALLKSLGADYVKIASTDLTNRPLIGAAIQTFRRTIISTGMARASEVAQTVEALHDKKYEGEFELMHCVSLYPCPLESSNISRIKMLRELSGLKVGYSDHSQGVESALLALATGSTTFEKHFTLDKSLPGFDHKYACNGEELRVYIATIKAAFEAISANPNSIATKEAETKIRARRGVYAARNIMAGEVIAVEDLLHVRPSVAEATVLPEDFLGKTARDFIPQYAALQQGDQVEATTSNWKEASQYWDREMSEKRMNLNLDDEPSDK